MVGPSAIGSENGTPSSITSAPASTSARITGTSDSSDGSPAVTKGIRALRLSARRRANVWSKRFIEEIRRRNGRNPGKPRAGRGDAGSAIPGQATPRSGSAPGSRAPLDQPDSRSIAPGHIIDPAGEDFRADTHASPGRKPVDVDIALA